MQELKEAVKKTKAKKQPGPDAIFPEIAKRLGPLMKKKLFDFYNNVWQRKYSIPAEWKKAVVIPILKPIKPAGEINRYQPISLSSVLGKIMERMIIARLNWYLVTQLLTLEQAGFRSKL